MIATIRTGARIFKAAINQTLETTKKLSKTANKIWQGAKKQGRKLKNLLWSFYNSFRKRNKKNYKPILITLKHEPEKKSKQQLVKKNKIEKKGKPRKKEQSKNPNQKTQNKAAPVTPIKKEYEQKSQLEKSSLLKAKPSLGDAIKNFYQEWETNWGPALTPLDRKFLETAGPDIVEKVIANGHLTLKSPYLKAVYNGLKDLQDISDLLEIDELAKEKVMPLFKDYWENSPEKFPDMLLFMHDKGTFPTRFGERQLSLDPRLVPGWLGLVG